MFASLRSRLWLTYALVVGAALGVVLIGLVWYVARNPPAERQLVQNLKRAADNLVDRPETVANLQTHPEEASERIATALNLRVLMLAADGAVLADSGSPGEAVFGPLAMRLLTRPSGLVRDRQGQVWLHTTRPLPAGGYVLLAAPRPARRPLSTLLRIREVLADELLPPLFQAGGVALLLALALSFWVARWVASPLQRIAAASRKVAEGRFDRLPLEGPREVQDLARAFNEMNDRVQASQQSQRDFVANVSHELKTPLTSIQGFAQAILDGAASSPTELQQAAGVIYTEAGRMHRLVLELLDLARFDAGTAPLEMAPLDLAPLVEAVAEQYQPTALQAGIRLEAQVAPLLQVRADGDRLSQVFTNLVDNAIKFTPAGGLVTFSLARQDDLAVVSVSDSGPGIPPGETERIFERFYQTDKARPGGRGSGLGLAIAREIVLAHGGTIEVQNNPPHGCNFVVKLPLARGDDGLPAGRRVKSHL